MLNVFFGLDLNLTRYGIELYVSLFNWSLSYKNKEGLFYLAAGPLVVSFIDYKMLENRIADYSKKLDEEIDFYSQKDQE